jgi:predicted phage-related endonuclease
LESQNEVFKVQLEELKEEKEDMVAHLERCLSETRTNAKELEDRLYGTHEVPSLSDSSNFNNL